MSSGTAKTTTNPLIELLTQHRSPGSIAGGLAFGTVLGLIPKDSLLALCLLALIAILPVNQLVACLSTVCLTLSESLTWGVTDWIGFQTLSIGVVSSFIGNIYQLPIVPWLRLENTIVMGSVVLGALLWGPCFLITYRVSSRLQKAISVDEVTALAAAALRRQSIPRMETLQPARVLAQLPSVTPVPPAEPIEFHEELQSVSREEFSTMDCAGERRDLEDQILHETLIEVIRFKRPTQQPAIHEPVDSSSSTEKASMHLTNIIRKDSSNVSLDKSSLPGRVAMSPVTTNVTHVHNQPHSKEDSLRNILKHIHTARESKREVERSS